MVLFFWEKGFFFNRFFYSFDGFFIKNFIKLNGFGVKFFLMWSYRCENFYAKLDDDTLTNNQKEPVNHFIKSNLTVTQDKNILLDDMPFVNLYLLNYYLMQTWPIAKNYKIQVKFNMWFYYLNRTYRGFSLKIAKPLNRRTRYRTYYRPNLGKPKNTHYDKTRTSAWFN